MGSFQGLTEFVRNLPKGKALITFIATFIVVCTISVLCYRLTLEVIDAGQWVGHTHRVLSEIHESISAVREMEGAQRGYIITGMDEFARSYELAKEKVRMHVRNLKSSVVDNTVKEHQLPELERLIEARILRAQETLESRKDIGFSAAEKQIAQNLGAHMTAEIKAVLDRMEDHETELLAARYETLTQSTEVTISALAILGALATTLLCLSFYSTNLYIMERRRSEEETSRYAAELAISKARLDAILASMGDGLYQIDIQGRIVFINPACEAITGYSQSELLGRNLRELIADRRQEETGSHSVIIDPNPSRGLFSVIENGGTFESIDQNFIGKDGKLVPVHYVSSPLEKDGVVIGAVVTFRDVTMRKEAEKRVAEFYSTVSHELRSPLTSIRGALGLMEGGKAGEMPARATRLVGIAKEECDRLIRLINDILDIRKIEVGKLSLFLKKEKIDEIIAATVDGIKPMAAEARVKFKLNQVDPNLSVFCDRDRIIQVLNNLIGNAVKFSSEDQIVTISATEVKGGASERSFVRVEVKDCGPGIAEAERDKLFTLFQQVDSSDSRPKGGTGLGLAISKALVEQHNGTIGFDSNVGEGSTFWFELEVYELKKDLKEKVAKLADRFTEELPERIDYLLACLNSYEASCVEARDNNSEAVAELASSKLAEARTIAHKLSGSAGSYGLAEIGNIMLSIEKKLEALMEAFDPRVVSELKRDLEHSFLSVEKRSK
jgi:PAS domain S-box-containing protein